MLAFAFRRILWTIPVLFAVVTMVFVLTRAIEGDPFRHGPLLGLTNVDGGVHWVKYGDYQPPAIKANLEERYELDLPWWRQYLNFLEGVVRFDYGRSTSFRDVHVNDILKEQAPRSIELGLLAFGWALLIGIPAGVLAALRPNSPFDYGARLFSNLGFAAPNFLVATLLVHVVSLELGWLPTNGWEGWRYKILPALTLGLLPMAYLTRLVRGAMLETLAEDYVRGARAKGLRGRRVVGAHALRNSLIPAATATGPLLGAMLTGSFVVELIFSVPGIGRYYIASVVGRDYMVVLAITVLLAVLVVLVNLLVDLLHGLLDPRVRTFPGRA